MPESFGHVASLCSRQEDAGRGGAAGSKASATPGWQYIEDDVDRYCPDRELILQLYEEAERLILQKAQARQ